MCRITIVAIGMLLVAVTALGQITPEEAAKRLQEKAAARQAERAKLVTITQGELEDMRAEIMRLKTQVKELQASQATGQTHATGVRLVPKIAVGVTRAELQKFLQVHKTEYQIVSDSSVVASVVPGQPVVAGTGGTMLLTALTKHKIKVGVGTNGITKFQDYHEELRPDAKLTVVFSGDAITSVNEQLIPWKIDEMDYPQQR